MDEKDMQNFQGQYPAPEMEPVMSVGQWVLTILVLSIPCVNIVMLFVWGFGGGIQSRANYCKAILIWVVIWIALTLIFSLLFGAVLGTALGSL